MNRKVGEDVQKIILNFIGFFGPFGEGCHSYTNKGIKCKSKTAGNCVFCRKHKNLIKKLANGDDFKYIAIAYLLLCYKGPNRKKITSNGIISKKIKEVPLWIGRSSCSVSDSWFYETRYRRKKKVGYCMCPWCIEQYFKFFNRYSDRIISIRKIIDNDNYPYNSIIDLFNNNIIKINETIKKKRKKKSIDFWYSTMIPKKRLLNQFNGNYFLPLSSNPIKIIENSYSECANNTKSVFKANGFDDIVKTQYMKSNSAWSGNAHRLENTCHLVSLSSYEMINIVVFKKIINDYLLEILDEDVIGYILSFLLEKKRFKKSFLRKKRINFWKLVDPKRNFWVKVNEKGEYIRYDGLAGAGGRL